MFRIFRKIKQELLVTAKFRKYLLYAIGEVILIVIGLLIAVQLNNLNTRRIQKNELEKSLIDLQNEIARKMYYFQINYDFAFTARDTIYSLYLDKELDKEYFLETNFTDLLISFAFPEVNVSNENISKVLSKEHLMDEEYSNLLECLKEYTNRAEEYSNEAQISLQIANDNIEYLADNYEWYLLEDSSDYQQMADFFLTNKIIRNKLYLLYRASRYEHFSFTGLYSLNTMLYAYLGLLNGTIQDQELDSVFQSFSYEPLSKIDCQNNDPQKVSGYLSTYMHLFYNASIDTVTINRLADDLSVIESFSIKPKGFNVFGNKPGRLFEIQNEDSCERFVARRKGYLLIK